MKKIIVLSLAVLLNLSITQAATVVPVPTQIKLPSKYTQEYIDSLTETYEKVSNEQIFHVALDMLKGTSGDFSRKAILGYNLTQKPIKIEFKDLSTLNESYSSFDSVGWKKKNKLYI